MLQSMKQPVIDTVALILVRGRKLLLVRPKGKNVYYMPGGKREKGETDIETLKRELHEELGIGILDSSARFAGEFVAQAHGAPKGELVSIRCYTATVVGNLVASGEIEEMRYFTSEEYFRMGQVAAAVQKIFFKLKKAQLVE